MTVSNRGSVYAGLFLFGYLLIMLYRFVHLGGFYAYSFDDVVRALIARDWRSSWLVLHACWLPLPMLVLSKILLLFPDYRIPSLWNLALTILALCALLKCARNLFPHRPWLAWGTVFLAMLNLQFIVLSISGASEPMLWCLVLWHFKKWLDYMEKGLWRDLALSWAFMGLACWTRPEAWAFLPPLTLWSVAKAAGGGWALSAGRVRRVCGQLALLWLPLAAFFLAYFLFFHRFYWKVESEALQHGGWPAWLHYPKTLWGMFGWLGAAGCLAGLLEVRSNVKLRWYAGLVFGAFALFILSAVRAGYALYYWRTVVLFALLMTPIVAAGWEGLLAKAGLMPWISSKAVQGTCLVLAGVFLWLRTGMALGEWDRGLALTNPMEASIFTALSQPYEKRYPAMMTELYTGLWQKEIHAQLLFRLFSAERPILTDREPRYDMVSPNDLFRLVQKGNPSLLDLPVERLRAALEERGVGAIVMVSAGKGRNLARGLGWPARSIGMWLVLTRPAVAREAR